MRSRTGSVALSATGELVAVTNSVRARRQELGLTQEALAAACEVSRQTIIALERGGHEPTLRLAMRLSRVLGTRVDELFRED